MEKENKGNIIIYQSEDGNTHLEVRLDDKTVWLTQQQMADLYQTSRTNVVEHIKHIYEEKELTEEATWSEIPTGSNGRYKTGRKRTAFL